MEHASNPKPEDAQVGYRVTVEAHISQIVNPCSYTQGISGVVSSVVDLIRLDHHGIFQKIRAGCMSHLPGARGRVVSALPLSWKLAFCTLGVPEEGALTGRDRGQRTGR